MYRADKKFWIRRLKSSLYVSFAYCDILIISSSLARLSFADYICVLKIFIGKISRFLSNFGSPLVYISSSSF